MSLQGPVRRGMLRPATTASRHLQSSHLRAPLPIIALASRPRAFSTSLALLGVGYPNQGIPRDRLGKKVPIPAPSTDTSSYIPPYPYGERQVYKQSNRGLYGNARIRFGNNVSKRRSIKTHSTKTPRKWRPNVHRRRLWSMGLRCFVQTRVTTRVLRSIDKCGGLDEYLLGDKAARIKELGPWGWKLRWRLMQSDVVKERFAKERVALGLAPRPKKKKTSATATKKGVQKGKKAKAVQAAVEKAVLKSSKKAKAAPPKKKAKAAVRVKKDQAVQKTVKPQAGPAFKNDDFMKEQPVA